MIDFAAVALNILDCSMMRMDDDVSICKSEIFEFEFSGIDQKNQTVEG